MGSKGVRRFSVSVRPELLEEFDKTIKGMGYERSKAIQLAMQNFLTEYTWMRGDEGDGVGAVIILYNHETRGLEENLTHIQHEYRDVICSSTHIHLDEENCLEILAVKGNIKLMKRMAERLMGERGVKQLRLATLKT
ncbi:MAG: nickel-responsive transcriptional regulator NikR [Nitrososphaerota archaeon]|nr:nickel-responsive transcriptional regulator NikR [Candidatus Bathyarchaeota archaeon]MDW8048565.1 nickel-responsive transcriptional regulator NikR [Nitrososphaerota archaeon]